jgi:hypothetical protein
MRGIKYKCAFTLLNPFVVGNADIIFNPRESPDLTNPPCTPVNNVVPPPPPLPNPDAAADAEIKVGSMYEAVTEYELETALLAVLDKWDADSAETA